MSIKWTGLAAIGIIVIILLIKIFNPRMSAWLSPESYPFSDLSQKNENKANTRPALKQLKIIKTKEAIASIIVIMAFGFITYAIPFYIHFSLLNKSGQGDAFMSASFQDELKNGKENTANPLSFWDKFLELNSAMYFYNTNLSATHPFSSNWNQWPIDKKPIYYWYQGPTNDNGEKIGKIYFLGNPIVWWLAFGAIIFTILRVVSKKERQSITPFMYFLVIAYLANLLPFMSIKRVAFLYHYLLSITFAILLLSIYLEQLWQKDKAIFTTIIATIAIIFIILTPLSYGWLMTQGLDQYEMKIINLLS